MRLDTQGDMISFDPYENFNINRILLLAVGLWPYQRSTLVQLQLILVTVDLISLVAIQLTTFMTVECTTKLVIRIFSSTLFCIMFIIEHYYFWANSQTIKYLMEQLQRICNELKDENEIAIIKKYGSNAKFCTTAITLSSASSLCAIFSLPIWPRILDVVLSANKSRARYTTQIMTEYFVDPEKYFLLILLHIDASYCIGIIILIGTGTMKITYIIYACGMFRIASYRIQRALSNDIPQKVSPKKGIKVYKEIVYAVDIHRKALKYCELLVSGFEGMFMFLLVFGVLSLSLNLFRIFQIVSFGGNIDEFCMHFIYAFIDILYMFLSNYAAQEVTDHNDHVFITTYNIQWYAAPLHIQRMILFLLQRGTKTFNLTIGGLVIGSMESFTSLISVSLSYFTVIYSTQ